MRWRHLNTRVSVTSRWLALPLGLCIASVIVGQALAGRSLDVIQWRTGEPPVRLAQATGTDDKKKTGAAPKPVVKSAPASNTATPPQKKADEPAPASTEPGGIKAYGKLTTTASGCQFYFPAEFFGNPSLFTKKFQREDFDHVGSENRCTPGQLMEQPYVQRNYNLDFRLPKKFDAGSMSSTLVFELKGKLTGGRFDGPVRVWAQVWDRSLKNVLGPHFGGEESITVYYRNGHLFLNEADYSRPMREAAAQKAREAAVVADAARKKADEEKSQREAGIKATNDKRDVAFKDGKCDEVKTLDQALGDRRYGDCLAETALKGSSAREIFLTAARLDADKDRANAKRLYSAIMEKFPKDDLAIDAAKRLAALSDVETIERSNNSAADRVKSTADQQKQARDAAAAREAECSHVFVGKQGWTGLLQWEVISVSPDTQRVTVRPNSGSAYQIGCHEVPR